MPSRRNVVHGGIVLTGAGLMHGLTREASAQDLQTLRVFVPAAPGGGWDQTARAIDNAMRSDRIVAAMQLDYAPGAGGTIGLAKFVSDRRAQPDTFLIGGMVMVGAIVANKSATTLSDTTPLARLTGEIEVVVVPDASPFKSMGDVVAAVQANSAGVTWAGGSEGGTDHILVGMIARAAGSNPRRINYTAFSGGGPAQAALLGGKALAGVAGWSEFAEAIRAGKLRALAISAGERQEGIAVPTLKEQGIDVELYNWRGVFGAPAISRDERRTLIDAFERMVRGRAWQTELTRTGWTNIYLPGDAFSAFLDNEVARVKGMLKDLGLA